MLTRVSARSRSDRHTPPRGRARSPSPRRPMPASVARCAGLTARSRVAIGNERANAVSAGPPGDGVTPQRVRRRARSRRGCRSSRTRRAPRRSRARPAMRTACTAGRPAARQGGDVRGRVGTQPRGRQLRGQRPSAHGGLEAAHVPARAQHVLVPAHANVASHRRPRALRDGPCRGRRCRIRCSHRQIRRAGGRSHARVGPLLGEGKQVHVPVHEHRAVPEDRRPGPARPRSGRRRSPTPARAPRRELQRLVRRGPHHRAAVVLDQRHGVLDQGLCVEVADRDSAEVRVTTEVARTTPAVGLNSSVAGERPPVDGPLVSARGRGPVGHVPVQPAWSGKVRGTSRLGPRRSATANQSQYGACARYEADHVRELIRLASVTDQEVRTLSSCLLVPLGQNPSVFCLTFGLTRTSVRLHALEEKFASPLRGRGSWVLSTLVRAACRCTLGRRRRFHARKSSLAGGSRRRTPSTPGKHWSSPRTSTSSTSARPTTCTGPWPKPRSPPGKHVICEKPLAIDDRGAEEMLDAAISIRACPRGPVRLPLHPMVREAATACRPGSQGIRLIHGGLSAGLAAGLRRQLARRRVDRWRVSRVRGHRLAPVRSRRVRVRSQDHARERATTEIPGARHRKCRDHAVRDGQGRGRLHGHQPDLGGPQEPLTLEIDAADEALFFNQEEPETSGSASAKRSRCSSATRASCPRTPRGSPTCPPATRRATTTLSTPSSRMFTPRR